MRMLKIVKGFTLLEMLIVIFISSSLLLVAIPNFQQLKNQLMFSLEQKKLALFLRKAQAKVANSNDIWFLIANRDFANKRWCLTIQRKDNFICDCFFSQSCPESVSAQFYFSYSDTMLSTKSYYPKEISRFNGVRDTWETTCIALSDNQQTKVFSLFNVGSLRLKTKSSLSACLAEES